MATCIPCLMLGVRKRISVSSTCLLRELHGYFLPPTTIHLSFQKLPFTSLPISETTSSSSNAANSTDYESSFQPQFDPLSAESLKQQSTPPEDTAPVSTPDVVPPMAPDDNDMISSPSDFDETSMKTEYLLPDIPASARNESPASTFIPKNRPHTVRALTNNPSAFRMDFGNQSGQSSNFHETKNLSSYMDHSKFQSAHVSPIDTSEILDRLLKRNKNPSKGSPISLTEALSQLSLTENFLRSPWSRRQLLAEHLIAQGDKLVPTSTWVLVENISPISSLQAMLTGIQNALDVAEKNGIVDLDKDWRNGEPIPLLDLFEKPTTDAASATTDSVSNHHKWVRKAKLILSPFGRPTGWYMQFDNRSIVYALLNYAKGNIIRCTWREVRVQEYKNMGDSENSDPVSNGNFFLNESISDSTLRVENCPHNVTEASMLNFFSRYDLKQDGKAIEQWHGVTTDGQKSPPTTFLVHFADTSWARAALREKQNTYMYKLGQPVMDYKNPKPLRLVQYPRQML